MRLIQRYLFRQLLGPTLAATLALLAIGLLTQTLFALNIIVEQHQTAAVFGKIVLLSMPQMVSIILPISLFVAALLTLNRLHTEQEIVVCFAGGVSRWSVVSPFLRLAAFTAMLTLVTTLWIAPWCQRQRFEELTRIKTDLIASLVREGAFTQPGKGLTFYAQSSDSSGVLHNIFIDQQKDDGSSSTFNARTGEIVLRAGAPAMILHDGSTQGLSKTGALNYLTFGQYVFDLAPYTREEEVITYKASDRYLHELFKPDKTLEDTQRNRKRYIAEGHARLAAPLYDFAVVALALAGVLGGAFSRTGYGTRIAWVAAAALMVRILGVGAQAACAANVGLNFLQYAVPLIPLAASLRILLRSPRPGNALAAITPLQPVGAT
jgi:lipopolysaccharide export system permease protein